MKRKHKTYGHRPSDNIISKQSMVSLAFGVAELVGYMLLISRTFYTKGQSGAWIGFFGWIFFVLAIVGLYLAFRSLKDTATVREWKIAGLTTNVLGLGISLVIFFLGIMR